MPFISQLSPLLPDGSEVLVQQAPSGVSIPAPSIPVSTLPIKCLRVIESGILQYPSTSTFWVRAEGFPIWLLSLDRSFVKCVYLLGETDAGSYSTLMRERGCDLSLINLALG
jgi:hypothetical protein